MNRSDIEAAARIVYKSMPPTPQYRWPLLCDRLGVELWLKHENHSPVGAFKVRGGLVYFDSNAETLRRLGKGVICATRGNHGQSIAFAAAKYDIPVTILVPHGNSVEKNAAMRGLGATLIESGQDFQQSLDDALRMADRQGLHFVPSFEDSLVCGVATYSLELLTAVDGLDVLYVPIGLGSGICGALAARDALGLKTEIVGVVSANAPAYLRSFEAGRAVECEANTRIADGMACRKPHDEALPIVLENVSRIVAVTDEQVEQAMRDVFECTHNVAEGAGAAAIAAITVEATRLKGKKVAAPICGGNVDRDVFAKVLSDGA
ncbi:MAG: threonine dehydratase [Planctomycetota bacterium]